jgi:hypothetical protein
MPTFLEADQKRVALKMKLANYSWYKSSSIISIEDGWGIIVIVEKLDNKVRKMIPPVIDGITVKTEVE